jgi:hypothetical protein
MDNTGLAMYFAALGKNFFCSIIDVTENKKPPDKPGVVFVAKAGIEPATFGL